MKIQSNKLRTNHGSILMVSLVVTSIIGLTLVSYLSLIRTQNVSVVHSQAWNAAIAVAEAGVEEAFAQLNPGLTSAPLNLAANSWTETSGNYYAPPRALGSGAYNVMIVPGATPVIYSTGYTTVSYSAVPIARTVRVMTTNAPLFLLAMGAKLNIDLKGNSINIDSFDSSNPLYSTFGRYDPLKAKDKGDVATSSGLTNSLSVGNAKIKGKIRTGATGVPYLGPEGSVGSAAWVNGGNEGIEGGWFNDDFNVEFPDVLPPFNGGAATPVGKAFLGTNFTYVLGTDNYELAQLNLKAGEGMLVLGNAVLYVTGNVLMQGSSHIFVAPGASLKIYVGGPSAVFTQVNTWGNPASFQYYGLPTNTSLTWSGNAMFLGTVYAPSADFTMGGGGNNVYDFQGCCVTSSVTMNGHFNFHYDENLARNGPVRGYVPSSWTEL